MPLPLLLLANEQIVSDHTYQAQTVALSNDIWPVAQDTQQLEPVWQTKQSSSYEPETTMDLAKQDAAGANCDCLALHKSCCKCHHANIKTFTLSKGCCKYWSCCTCTKTLPMSFSILLPFYTKPACQKACKVGARLCFCGRAVLQSDYDTTRFTLTYMV